MPKVINYNALGQILDNTWGRTSTPKTSSYSVKFTYAGGDRLVATFNCIMNFASSGEAQMIKKTTQNDADTLVSHYTKSLKSKYKEITSESLTLKEVSATDSVEMIGGGYHHTSKRTAYYRKTFIYEMS
jgi:hypothetical protein